MFNTITRVLLRSEVTNYLFTVRSAYTYRGRENYTSNASSLTDLILNSRDLTCALILIRVATTERSTERRRRVNVLRALSILGLRIDLSNSTIKDLCPFDSNSTCDLSVRTASTRSIGEDRSFSFLRTINGGFVCLDRGFVFFVTWFGGWYCFYGYGYGGGG